MTEESAKTLTAAHRIGTGFWNSVNRLIAQSLMRPLVVIVLHVVRDRSPAVALAEDSPLGSGTRI